MNMQELENRVAELEQTLEEKTSKLEDQVDSLRELFFNRMLYNQCMHQSGIYCENGVLQDTQCGPSNCPILDNPNDI